MKQNKRLIFIISSSIAGGGQIYLYNILSYLSDIYSLLLVCPSGYLSDKVESELAVDVVRMPINMRSVGQLKRLLKDEMQKYGRIYVNAHLLGTGLWTRRAIHGIKNTSFTVTLHNKVIYPDMAWYKRFLYPLFLRYVSSSGCGFIAVSQEIADSVKAYSGRECMYIPSSVPIKEPPVTICTDISKKDPIRIGFVGRLSLLKNPIRFLEMAILVKKNIAQARFVMIGDGELRPEVEDFISKNGMSGYVTMKGFVSKPGPEMRKLDVLVISSNSEGTPLVLLESMSYGVPVVSTSVGAIPLVIDNGVDGVLCDCTSKSLADGVRYLLSNGERFKIIASNAFEKIENKYSYKRNIQNYLKVMMEQDEV